MKNERQEDCPFELIIEGLNKSYILNKETSSSPFFFEKYNITPEQYAKDSIMYHEAKEHFFSCSQRIIEYLIDYRDSSDTYCNWIYSTDPYSASLSKYDLMSKASAAKILIDNYYNRSKNGDIVIRSYVDTLSWEAILKAIAPD